MRWQWLNMRWLLVLSIVVLQLTASGAGAGKLTPDQMQHILHGVQKPLLPVGAIDRGIVYRGAGWRLRRFVASLLAGNTVHVGVVGGSVSWGHGASVRGQTDWFSLFISWLRVAFPKATIHARNGCIPGTGTQLTLYCIEQAMDLEVDLIFEEFATNDGYFGVIVEPRTLAQERLLRKLLDFPKRPAVVMMNFVQLCHAPRAKDHPQNVAPCYFHQSPEDQYNIVAQYYDVASLSFRSMAWHMAGRNLTGWRWEDIMIDDLKHPNDKGFRMMADLAIRLIQRVVMEMSFRPYSHEDERHALHEPMPVPMFGSNYAPSTRCCAYQDELMQYVISHDAGWQWVNEGTEEKPKKGYVTNTAGSSISLRAPVRGSRAGAMVFVAYLKSYTPMGTAEMTCEGSCNCQPTVVDAFEPLHKFSQTFLARVLVTPTEQEGDCVVKVTTRASSNGSKFKVAGLMVVLEVQDDWQKLGFDFQAPFEVFEQGSGVLPLQPAN